MVTPETLDWIPTTTLHGRRHHAGVSCLSVCVHRTNNKGGIDLVFSHLPCSPLLPTTYITHIFVVFNGLI